MDSNRARSCSITLQMFWLTYALSEQALQYQHMSMHWRSQTPVEPSANFYASGVIKSKVKFHCRPKTIVTLPCTWVQGKVTVVFSLWWRGGLSIIFIIKMITNTKSWGNLNQVLEHLILPRANSCRLCCRAQGSCTSWLPVEHKMMQSQDSKSC